MRAAAYCTLLSVGVVSLADFMKAPGMIQYGALGLLGWIIWYLLVRAFPAHVKAQEKEREAYLAHQEKGRTDFLDSQTDARRDFREALSDVAHSIDNMAVAISGRQGGGQKQEKRCDEREKLCDL